MSTNHAVVRVLWDNNTRRQTKNGRSSCASWTCSLGPSRLSSRLLAYSATLASNVTSLFRRAKQNKREVISGSASRQALEAVLWSEQTYRAVARSPCRWSLCCAYRVDLSMLLPECFFLVLTGQRCTSNNECIICVCVCGVANVIQRLIESLGPWKRVAARRQETKHRCVKWGHLHL